MLFTLAWTHSPQARNETITKFMATGGMPPEGVQMLSVRQMMQVHWRAGH